MTSSTDAVKAYASKLHDQAHKLRRNNEVTSANDIDELGECLNGGDMSIEAVERAIHRMRELRPGLNSYDLLPD